MADVSQDEWNTLFFTEVRAPNGPSHVRDGLQLQELQALRREFAEHAGRPAPEMPPVMTNDQVVVLAQKLHELDNGIDIDVDTLTLAIVQALRAIVGASAPVKPES